LRRTAGRLRNKGSGHASGAFFFGGDGAMMKEIIEPAAQPLALSAK
jgi:hypothetical protein